MTIQLDLERIPKHVAIIMDGNGRWAQEKGEQRTYGHREGVEAVRRCVKAAVSLGVQYLTIYGFSTENWNRPSQEIGFLMGLLRSYFQSRLTELLAGNVRIRLSGDPSKFAKDIQDLLHKAVEKSASNTGMQLIVALNYGGRAEIIRAFQRASQQGIEAKDLDEARLSQFMDVPDVPDPDLMLRTSGEKRLSNFLLWQLAYCELVFLDIHWPEFDAKHFETALIEYQSRSRRYGGIMTVPAKQVKGCK